MARPALLHRIARIFSHRVAGLGPDDLELDIGFEESLHEPKSVVDPARDRGRTGAQDRKKETGAAIAAEERRLCGLLEVPISSSLAEKRQAYRRLCLRYHPDNFAGDQERLKIANELMIQLNSAIRYFEEKEQQHELL